MSEEFYARLTPLTRCTFLFLAREFFNESPNLPLLLSTQPSPSTILACLRGKHLNNISYVRKEEKNESGTLEVHAQGSRWGVGTQQYNKSEKNYQNIANER